MAGKHVSHSNIDVSKAIAPWPSFHVTYTINFNTFIQAVGVVLVTIEYITGLDQRTTKCATAAVSGGFFHY